MHARNEAREAHTLLITRVFRVPSKLVFEAWSQSEHMLRWLGPRGFTCLSCEIDFRVGGSYRARIRSATGEEYCMRGEYQEIVSCERIVMTFAWEEEGERGEQNRITLLFSESDGKTTFTFRQTPFRSLEQHDSHLSGWTECFDGLLIYLVRLATAQPKLV